MQVATDAPANPRDGLGAFSNALQHFLTASNDKPGKTKFFRASS
jgi:hypothetical protein